VIKLIIQIILTINKVNHLNIWIVKKIIQIFNVKDLNVMKYPNNVNMKT